MRAYYLKTQVEIPFNSQLSLVPLYWWEKVQKVAKQQKFGSVCIPCQVVTTLHSPSSVTIIPANVHFGTPSKQAKTNKSFVRCHSAMLKWDLEGLQSQNVKLFLLKDRFQTRPVDTAIHSGTQETSQFTRAWFNFVYKVTFLWFGMSGRAGRQSPTGGLH